jgi:hypothetical protein
VVHYPALTALASLPWEQLWPNEAAARESEAGLELAPMAAILRERGIEEPIPVRPRAQGDWEIIDEAGFARWRTAVELIGLGLWAPDVELPCQIIRQ